MGDADAGERGAIIYTVIETRRRRGIDPYAYLKDVLTRLPRCLMSYPAHGPRRLCRFNGKLHHKRHIR